MITATLAPHGDRPSRRTNRLPQKALDMIAQAFAMPIMVGGLMPANAVEVRLDDPIRHLLLGGEGLNWHGGSDGECYFKHLDDPNWAVVYRHDCPGDPERGLRLMMEAMNGDDRGETG